MAVLLDAYFQGHAYFADITSTTSTENAQNIESYRPSTFQTKATKAVPLHATRCFGREDV
jgi:hypothetical protein